MPKVVLGDEGGYPDAPHVRLAVRKDEVTQKVLAIEHPTFGWLKPFWYKFVRGIEKVLQRIDPVELLAIGGLTIMYKQTAEAAVDMWVWFTDILDKMEIKLIDVPPEGPSEGDVSLSVWDVVAPGGMILWVFSLVFPGVGTFGELWGGGELAEQAKSAKEAMETVPAQVNLWFWSLIAAVLTLRVGVPLASGVLGRI